MQHIKYDAGAYEGFEEEKERDQLNPEQTANGTDFTGIQVHGILCFMTCPTVTARDHEVRLAIGLEFNEIW